MVTPHLDALASESTLFMKNYVQQAVCSPTRTSLLTGRRPDTTHVYDLYSYYRDISGNFTSLPEFFRLQGYHTVGCAAFICLPCLSRPPSKCARRNVTETAPIRRIRTMEA